MTSLWTFKKNAQGDTDQHVWHNKISKQKLTCFTDEEEQEKNEDHTSMHVMELKSLNLNAAVERAFTELQGVSIKHIDKNFVSDPFFTLIHSFSISLNSVDL